MEPNKKINKVQFKIKALYIISFVQNISSCFLEKRRNIFLPIIYTFYIITYTSKKGKIIFLVYKKRRYFQINILKEIFILAYHFALFYTYGKYQYSNHLEFQNLYS